MSARTHWWAVGLLFLTGCTTALHIGKVPSALPLLRADWQLSLTQAGLILSIYAVLIAGALGMGGFAFFIFTDTIPVAARLACAFGFAIFGGLIPLTGNL